MVRYAGQHSGLVFGNELEVGTEGERSTIKQIRVFTPSLDPSSVSNSSVSTQTFSVSGLTTNDTVIVNPPNLTNGLLVTNARVSSADTLELTFYNNTGSSIDESSATWRIIAIRS